MGCSCSAPTRIKAREQTGSATLTDQHHRKAASHPAESIECPSAMEIKRGRGLQLVRSFGGRKKPLVQSQQQASENSGWLLANEDHHVGCKAGATENVDLSSVNSSFRISFGSRDLDFEINSNPNPSAALLVNVDEGTSSPGQASDFEWTRIHSLERQILPVVAKSLIRFKYDEIRRATSNFSDGKVLGRGAHSCVYRGRLRLGGLIAVKRLDHKAKDSDKAFYRELHIASTLKNRHVVPLLGFCIDRLGLFLVYKFISGGSLEHHLHERKAKARCLSWSARLRVAIGVAKAVDYLHHGTQRCVVHRDIKPSNILLSSRKTAKLCDFGLATWTLGPSVPFLCKAVKGTFGYLAPEYFQHGKVSEKTDIYAFGVVLLELITGRKPIETQRPSGDENLIIWARPFLYQGLAEELIDPQLKSCYDGKQMDRLMRAAAVCLHPTESWRPCMSHVLKILNGQADTRLVQHARLTLPDPGGEQAHPNARVHTSQDLRTLKGHLALALVDDDSDLGDSASQEDDRAILTSN